RSFNRVAPPRRTATPDIRTTRSSRSLRCVTRAILTDRRHHTHGEGAYILTPAPPGRVLPEPSATDGTAAHVRCNRPSRHEADAAWPRSHRHPRVPLPRSPDHRARPH